MGKMTKTKTRPWSITETKALKQFLPQLGIDAMATGLGRTSGAIAARARELKISIRKQHVA
jgi:hypothetical protein